MTENKAVKIQNIFWSSTLWIFLFIRKKSSYLPSITNILIIHTLWISLFRKKKSWYLLSITLVFQFLFVTFFTLILIHTPWDQDLTFFREAIGIDNTSHYFGTVITKYFLWGRWIAVIDTLDGSIDLKKKNMYFSWSDLIEKKFTSLSRQQCPNCLNLSQKNFSCSSSKPNSKLQKILY